MSQNVFEPYFPSKNIEREFEQISERIDRPNPFEEAIDVLSDIYDDLVDLEAYIGITTVKNLLDE